MQHSQRHSVSFVPTVKTLILIFNLFLRSYKGWWHNRNLSSLVRQIATVAKRYAHIDALFYLFIYFVNCDSSVIVKSLQQLIFRNIKCIFRNIGLFMIVKKLIWCQLNSSLTWFFPPIKIGHICGWQRRKTRHYPLMWVSLKHPSVKFVHILQKQLKTCRQLFCMFADRAADIVVVCDDLLWYRQHRRRVQRYGRLVRIENQVGSFVQQCDFSPCTQGIVCTRCDNSWRCFAW